MKLALTLSAMLLMGCSAATTPEAKIAPVPTFDTVAMDTLLSKAVSSGDVIGTSAMVFNEGQMVYQGAFGLGDRERETPVDMDTVWRIYSMTKPITSAVIMDLQEEGKLKLSDPVSKYIPELANMMVAKMGEDGKPAFEPQARPMTIEDLMLHRSGPDTITESRGFSTTTARAAESLSGNVRTLIRPPPSLCHRRCRYRTLSRRCRYHSPASGAIERSVLYSRG